MIRIGIVGCNYGHLVHLPAFRRDSRCKVIAIAGTDATKVGELSRAAGIPLGFSNWADLVACPEVDVISIAVPPRSQPLIAIRALELGKPVFAEKPLAANLADADAMMRAAISSRQATMLDFNFSAIQAWRKAKDLLDEGAIGQLRHVAVNWNVENYSTRMRIKNWKAAGDNGGGALGNFVSHSFHYLEWFCGRITDLSARLSGLPDDLEMETNAAISFAFGSGASGALTMSCASYLGSGHRLEFYGEDGTLTLVNSSVDYMRGFELRLARRPDKAFTVIEANDPLDRDFPSDGRIAPVSRLAQEFLDAIERGQPATPGFAEGYRVQFLLDAARRANNTRRWIDTGPEAMERQT